MTKKPDRQSGIPQFIYSTASGMDKNLIAALQAVQQQNATGLVLDLRNDPGGSLTRSGRKNELKRIR